MVALTIPPTMARSYTAHHFQTCTTTEPMGSKPAMMAATVIMIGRTRNKVPSIMAERNSSI